MATVAAVSLPLQVFLHSLLHKVWPVLSSAVVDTWDIPGIEPVVAAQRALLNTPELLPIVSTRDDWDYHYDKYVFSICCSASQHLIFFSLQRQGEEAKKYRGPVWNAGRLWHAQEEKGELVYQICICMQISVLTLTFAFSFIPKAKRTNVLIKEPQMARFIS